MERDGRLSVFRAAVGSTRYRLFLVSVAAVLVAFGCNRKPQPAPHTTTPMNVIVVLVDTLRADHMSLYGYSRATTPFIDRFASEAFVFERARSQAGCTFPSVNSLMTSRYPEVFAHQEKGHFGIPEAYPTIAEVLNGHGYQTAAVSASPIVRNTPSKLNPNGGFGRGFDLFIEGCVWGHGACVNRKIFEVLNNLEAPFFIYLHYMEPHAYYQPPSRYEKKFSGDYDGFDFIQQGNPKPISKMLYANGPEYEITDRDIQHLVDLYDDEIGYFDGIFRRLLKKLEARGQLEETMIVLASDHGEEFLEHGHIGHCRGVWDTLTRVPLVLRIPGVQGVRLDAAVQNLDVVPTILDYLEIDGEGFGFEGRSLRPLIEGREVSPRFAFSEQKQYRSSDTGSFHLIVDGAENTMTLFDVRRDPLEQHDLYSASHPELGPLIDALGGWFERTNRLGRLEESAAAARAKEEELRALGYIE